MKIFVLSFFLNALILIAMFFWQNHYFKKKLFKKTSLLKKQAHQDLINFKEKQVKELEKYHCLAEVGRLASGIIHDFANPLTALMLSLEQTCFRDLNEIKADEWGQKINEANLLCKRMAHLLKAASKQLKSQAEIKEPFSIKEEIDNVLSLLSWKAQSYKVNLRSNFEEEIFLNNNALKFNRIICNLVGNAIEAVDSQKKNSWVEIKARLVNERLIMSITDNGLGLPEDLKEKLFNPFFSTKKKNGNLGLGLAIVSDLVEKDFAGKIRVSSQIKKFTAFTIELPLEIKDIKIPEESGVLG